MAPKDNYIYQIEKFHEDVINEEITLENVILSESDVITRKISAASMANLLCEEKMPELSDSEEESEEENDYQQIQNSDDGDGDGDVDDSSDESYQTVKISMEYFIFIINQDVCCRDCVQQLFEISIFSYVLRNITFMNNSSFEEFLPPKCSICLEDIEYFLL